MLLQVQLLKEQLSMDKELDLSCWTKFIVLEMRQAYLIVLEILLDNMTVLILKMQVLHALQVNRCRSLCNYMKSYQSSLHSVPRWRPQIGWW